MELLDPAILASISRLQSSPSPLKQAFSGYFPRRRNLREKPGCRLKRTRSHVNSTNYPSSIVYLSQDSQEDCESFWEDSKSVEVIGIGSRKDAVLDFCLDSPFQPSSLRFWNILLRDSMKVQLLQKSFGKDIVTRYAEASISSESYLKAIILVASAGYGSEHVSAIEFIRMAKSANRLAVGILLKPFSFEGQRRQDEVQDLAEKLQDCTNFCLVVDTDNLLKTEVVTLDEALKSANSAVLLAINAIAVLVSEMHTKLLDAPHKEIKELEVEEVIKILEGHKEGRIGFGVAYDIKSSMRQALFDCPFLGGGVKEPNGMVICILASSGVLDGGNLHACLHTFRQTSECTSEIIMSSINEPNLEPGLIVTTVIILEHGGQQISQKNSFLSRLALHFPFIFSLLGRANPEYPLGHACPLEVASLSDSGEMPDMNAVDDGMEGEYDNGDEKNEIDFSNVNSKPLPDFYNQTTEGPTFQREPLDSWSMEPGYHIPHDWAKERAAVTGSTPVLDNLDIYTLPVGVKSSEDLEDRKFLNPPMSPEPKSTDGVIEKSVSSANLPSWNAFTDAGFEAVMEFYSAASTLTGKKDVDIQKKHGGLSSRAASMLEAERDSPKRWSPIMEMRYRGGIYQGRCQGGLPEGKGRLSLVDGSIYDGTWHYGKRSGVGTFYFNNGDVFQGSWRDDVMHGKGWFYFHTGDRWFANFWKGKANGEGRFYSKSGDVLFGHFQDGWRHGHFLCVSADGKRYAETWEEGVLISRKQMES